jgi:hypothetical protein
MTADRVAALRLRIHSDDRGSTLPLICAYAALAAALIVVVAAATSLTLERKRLLTVADGAALAAAEAWSFGEATGPQGRIDVRFDPAAVRRAVDDYLAASNASAGFAGFALAGVRSDDARGVTVTLRATWRGPGIDGVVPVSVPLEVTAHARSIIR